MRKLLSQKVTFFTYESSIRRHYDRNENQVPFKRPNAVFTYEEIVEFPRGKQLLDEFIKQNNISTSTTQTGARVTRLRGAQPTTVTQPFQPVSSRTRGNAIVTTI